MSQRRDPTTAADLQGIDDETYREGTPLRTEPIVRKARWGWWVNGRWCPTIKIRDHEIKRILNYDNPIGEHDAR